MSGNEVKAKLRYVRVSPQKVRKLIGAVKGKQVENGMNILKFMPQKAAGILSKVIHSAVANAEQKGTRILKRTSHITVILSEEST